METFCSTSSGGSENVYYLKGKKYINKKNKKTPKIIIIFFIAVDTYQLYLAVKVLVNKTVFFAIT